MEPVSFNVSDCSDIAFSNSEDVCLLSPQSTVSVYYVDSQVYQKLYQQQQQQQQTLLLSQYFFNQISPYDNISVSLLPPQDYHQPHKTIPLWPESPSSNSLLLPILSSTENIYAVDPFEQPPKQMVTPAVSTSTHNGTKRRKLPGPISASTTPITVQRDASGVNWLSFTYTRESVRKIYRVCCDIGGVALSTLPADFRAANCVYPRACVPPDQYIGNRQRYETECNAIGWSLAWINSELRGQRGLIQRAVDCWRNTNADPKMRSRRVRKISKKLALSKTPGEN